MHPQHRREYTPMRFTNLSSGSIGNATLIECGTVCILLDVGVSLKTLESLLHSREKTLNQITHVLITHEHADHVRGLGPLLRKNPVPVVANPQTMDAISTRCFDETTVKWQQMLQTGGSLILDEVQVQSFSISHDAVDPVGYIFETEQKKLCIATDLGYVNNRILSCLRDSDVLVIEANHDLDMLYAGKIPWNVKRRILSDEGHLSNVATGYALLDCLTHRTKTVYLAHMSQDHNTPDVAMCTVTTLLSQRAQTGGMRIVPTFPLRATEWETIG